MKILVNLNLYSELLSRSSVQLRTFHARFTGVFCSPCMCRVGESIEILSDNETYRQLKIEGVQHVRSIGNVFHPKIFCTLNLNTFSEWQKENEAMIQFHEEALGHIDFLRRSGFECVSADIRQACTVLEKLV